jgi:hypothetical protein
VIGSLDPTFSEDGKQTTNMDTFSFRFQDGESTNFAKALEIQGDGKIVLAGMVGSVDHGGAMPVITGVARYNTDGALDPTFSDDGKLITPFTFKHSNDILRGDIIEDIAISENKLYMVGVPFALEGLSYGLTKTMQGVIMKYLLDDNSTNKPPAINLGIPYNIIKYSAPARIKLNATATDEDGTITKVQFFNGTTRLHTEVAYPYGFLWIDVPVGNYTLTAKAFDNSGNVTTSNSIKVSVVEENVPPVVSIVSPIDDTTYTGPATIRLIAKAKDPNDKISKVEFYSGSTLIRTEHYYPYTYTWTDVQPGTYTITAKAYDDKGLSATSKAVKVTVTNASIVSRPSSVNIKTDLNDALSLRLSPVPARSTLQIYTKGLQLNRPSTISLMSSSGVLLKLSNQMHQIELQLDVSSLASGVYTIKVINGGKVAYKQFVKL